MGAGNLFRRELADGTCFGDQLVPESAPGGNYFNRSEINLPLPFGAADVVLVRYLCGEAGVAEKEVDGFIRLAELVKYALQTFSVSRPDADPACRRFDGCDAARQFAPEPGTPSMSFGAAPQELTIPPAAMKRFRISIVLRRIVVISGSSTAL